MPAAANGHTAVNGHAGGVKSSAVKSRGALKRLKAKAKAARASTEPPSDVESAHSDAEVSSQRVDKADISLLLHQHR